MEQTLFLIKPNVTGKNKVGRILKMVEENGFTIQKMKMFKMSQAFAFKFYEIHKEKSFFEKLVKFMCSGKTVAVLLQRENAIDKLRELVGDTNPQKANLGSIRYLFGDDITRNAVHASDSQETAQKEIKLVFAN